MAQDLKLCIECTKNKFESKSQQTIKVTVTSAGCVSNVQRTNLKANHNYKRLKARLYVVVYRMYKEQI